MPEPLLAWHFLLHRWKSQEGLCNAIKRSLPFAKPHHTEELFLANPLRSHCSSYSQSMGFQITAMLLSAIPHLSTCIPCLPPPSAFSVVPARSNQLHKETADHLHDQPPPSTSHLPFGPDVPKFSFAFLFLQNGTSQKHQASPAHLLVTLLRGFWIPVYIWACSFF